uniref:DR1 associated protein 1 n=1 Tax=Pavo cristatus TaxID=9049 RepID=A0A8C9FPY6_PAVCR
MHISPFCGVGAIGGVARIKKIMQTDEEIGKVAAAVPVIISYALWVGPVGGAWLVVERGRGLLTPRPLRKQCIELEQQFDFLKDLVAAVPDMQGEGDEPHGEGERAPRRYGGGPWGAMGSSLRIGAPLHIRGSSGWVF